MAVLRVMPDSTDRDMKKLEESLKAAMPRSAKLQGVQVKPIAFGLKALLIAVTVSDAEGGTEMGRCGKCRQQSNQYVCPKCAFQGP